MNRSIKFRGRKVLSNEWLYGYLIKSNDHAYIIDELGNEVWYNYEVIPETVGELTGLKDKNGKEIYEGDIIRATDENVKIFFNDSTACFDVEFMGGDCEPLVPHYVEWYADQHEIIGNIYENPELLKS